MGTTGKCLVLAWCCALLIAGGCAKQEVVAKDKPLAPPAAAAAPSPSVALWNKGDTTAPAPSRQRELPTEAVASPVVAGSDRQSASGQQEPSVAGLDRIYFAFDSAGLSAAARQTLAQNAELLKKSGIKVRIEGNCDERGSDEYNLALGEKRAKAAMQYLTTLGVPAERLSVISFGKENPAVAGHDEAAWARNRRDEFVAVK